MDASTSGGGRGVGQDPDREGARLGLVELGRRGVNGHGSSLIGRCEEHRRRRLHEVCTGILKQRIWDFRAMVLTSLDTADKAVRGSAGGTN
jgi:hypothetical protein